MASSLRGRRRVALLVGFSVITLMTAYLLWSGYRDAIHAAETTGRNVAAVLDARLDATLRRTDSILEEVVVNMDEITMSPVSTPQRQAEIDADLDLHAAHFPELAGLRVFDAHGELLYTNGRQFSKGRAHVDDRRFFQSLRDHPDLKKVYSEAFLARSTATTSIAVVYPIRRNGKFLGVTLALINLDYFQALLSTLDLGRNAVTAVRRSDDFSLILRQPALEKEINKGLPEDNPTRRAIGAGAREQVIDFRAATDGVRRIFCIRALPGHPFYVLVALARDDVLAEWRQRVQLIAVGAVLLLVLLALMQRRIRLGELDLETSAARIRLLAGAFEHSGEALVVTDRDNRIVEINAAFTRLTGYAAAEVIGQNPKMLSAGRTTADEYRRMWEALEQDGFWQGEMWDRRKDGEIYPKWLTISVVRNAGNAADYYIGNFTDISAHKATEERIRHLAHHDALTGLPNRFSLQGRLEQALAAARRDGTQLGVMFIDMDRFKTINDTLGHHVGDGLLVEVAQRLRDCVRESDIVARLGGDEFVVALTAIDLPAATTLAGKLMAALARPYIIEDHKLHSTPSIGICLFPEDGETADVLMKNADTAMYHAKSAGRNNYQFFAARMNESAAERLVLEGDLRLALEHGELLLHYQPQIEIASDRVVGIEALVRWQHPEHGLVAPGLFIPIAEETGLIMPIGKWVLEEALRQLSAWRQEGIAAPCMAVNLSAHQLRDPGLPDTIRTRLEQYGLHGGDLELEVTESVAMQHPEKSVALLCELHGIGVELAIDDFGTGYSSLAYLKQLPLDRLKLDRSFVMDIEQDANDAAICAATISLAHALGLAVVAEGVETATQLEFLRRLGCDVVQGYYFSRPLPAADCAAFLRARQRAG